MAKSKLCVWPLMVIFLGYRALIIQEPYAASAVAIEPCHVCVVDSQVFLMF